MDNDIRRAWASAWTFSGYRERLSVHANTFDRIYERLRFVRDVEAEKAPLANCRILVLTEDFCVDSVLNLPLIGRLAEASPTASLRIASRDSNRPLANRFPGRGGVSRLPTVIFLDGAGNVYGHWSERSKRDHVWMSCFLARDPMPELVLRDGHPLPLLAEWMERRLQAQLPFLTSTSWRCVRDELSAVANRRNSRPADKPVGSQLNACGA